MPKSFTTSNLVSHLRVSHPELEKEYNLLQNARREVASESTEISPPSSSSRQLTLPIVHAFGQRALPELFALLVKSVR